MNKTCIIIAGPTAVGKTVIAISLARLYNTEIISADSRQCFKELNIGVAKPTLQDLAIVPHHFISSHSVTDDVNAAVFESYALNKAALMFSEKDLVIMAGGTGLYIKAFYEGIDEVPPITEGVRNNIVADFEKYGLAWLQLAVAKNDPFYYATGETKNPQRLMRALEVVLSTGESILNYQKKQPAQRNFRIIKIGLELPRSELYSRINQRVNDMMQVNLLQEVQNLQPYQHLNALQTVGYKELFNHLNGAMSLQNAIEAIKINTRHYAKRQITWFQKDKEIIWCAPDEKAVKAIIEEQLGLTQ